MKALEEKPEKAIKKALKEDKKVPEKEELLPTAMEMAWREAMERSQTQNDEEVKQKQKAIPKDNEMDDLLSRTLEHQVKTASE